MWLETDIDSVFRGGLEGVGIFKKTEQLLDKHKVALKKPLC